jgi:hypothetical protein
MLLLLLSLASIVCLCGCTVSGGSNAGHLLGLDYQKMTNAELTAYEQQLSDEIARVSAGSSPVVSLGLGLGSWGSHAGVGVGVEHSLGGNGSAFADLIDRRDAVRTEMRKRGLLPTTSSESSEATISADVPICDRLTTAVSS